MNGRGGCCIARYAGGGGIYRGLSNVDRIMLKFRPIAPKPVASGSGSFSGGSTTENSDGYVKCRKAKRKYVRVNGNKKKGYNSKRCSDENKKMIRTSSSPPPPAVTLSLLPEGPDRKEQSTVAGLADLLSSASTTKYNCTNNKRSAPAAAPVWLSFNNTENFFCYGDVGGVVVDQVVGKPPPPPQPRRLQAVSYVTVECLTNTTWVDGAGERVMNMEMDTCPGFISDSQDRVVWTNKAFREMVGGGHVFGGDDVSVVLVRKDKWTPSPVTYPTFTCKVKVSSAAAPPLSPPRTVPCDVWWMERGACAWRLDVKAALSLGR